MCYVSKSDSKNVGKSDNRCVSKSDIKCYFDKLDNSRGMLVIQ